MSNGDHVGAKVKDVKGRVKEEVGHATGNDTLATEGIVDRVKGKIQEGYANLKDGVKKVVDEKLEKR